MVFKIRGELNFGRKAAIFSKKGGGGGEQHPLIGHPLYTRLIILFESI
jgi:hypothetical protein